MRTALDIGLEHYTINDAASEAILSPTKKINFARDCFHICMV